MKIKEFKKAYATQIAGGRKIFDRFLLVCIPAMFVFRLMTGLSYNHYPYNHYSPFFIYVMGLVIFFGSIALSSVAQIIYDLKVKAVIPSEVKPYYFKYVVVKGIVGFLIIAGLISLVTGFMILFL